MDSLLNVLPCRILRKYGAHYHFKGRISRPPALRAEGFEKFIVGFFEGVGNSFVHKQTMLNRMKRRMGESEKKHLHPFPVSPLLRFTSVCLFSLATSLLVSILKSPGFRVPNFMPANSVLCNFSTEWPMAKHIFFTSLFLPSYTVSSIHEFVFVAFINLASAGRVLPSSR